MDAIEADPSGPVTERPRSPAGGGASGAPPDALSLATKFSYGFGEMAEGVKSATLETFLFFFYVQVIGLSGSLTGLALMLALVFDGLVDPVIGQISDRFRSPLGRRHPFLYVAPVPLAVFLVLLFSPPHGLSPASLFAWMLTFTILCRVMQSVYFVPHMALGAELSTDYRERISVAGYRTVFSYLGRLLALGVAFSLFFRPTAAIPNGQLNPAAYQPMAVTCGLIVIVVILVSAAGTQARTRRLYARQAPPPAQSKGLVKNLANAFRLKAFSIYFTAVLINYVLGGVQAALGIHINTYYWRLAPADIQTVFFANVFGFMAGVAVTRPLANRLDKKVVYVTCLVISVLLGSLPILLAETGLLPVGDRAHLPWVLAAFTFFTGFVGGPAVVVAGAMLADIADAYQLRFGARSEGVLFGASAFTRKASIGVGGAIAGVALDLIRFPRGVPVEQISRQDALNVALLWGPGVLIFSLTAAGIMALYDLSRTQHQDILDALAAEHMPEA